MVTDLASVAMFFLAASRTSTHLPDVQDVLRHVHEATEPSRSSTRKLTIEVSSEDGAATQWIAGQAREKRGPGARMLTVMLAPEGVRGIAILVQPDKKWVFIPAVRRVRVLTPAGGAYESFLNTDFTYSDIGFVPRNETSRLVGKESRDGVDTYKIEAVPHDRWYYSRIVTWVAADSWLPIRREFSDPAGMLWKVETWSDVTRIDGIPIELRNRMEDVRQGGSTEIRVSDVLWDREFPEGLFDPRNLPEAASSPLWGG